MTKRLSHNDYLVGDSNVPANPGLPQMGPLDSPGYWIATLEESAESALRASGDFRSPKGRNAMALGEIIGMLRFHLKLGEMGAAIGNAIYAGMLAERIELGPVIEAEMRSRTAMTKGKQAKHGERLELFRACYTSAKELHPNKKDEALFDSVAVEFVKRGHKKPSRTTMASWKAKLGLSHRRK